MTILELLKQALPNRTLGALLNNIKNKEILNDESESIFGELMTLFDWSSSNEGYDYWESVFEALWENREVPHPPMIVEYEPGTMLACDGLLMIMNVGGSGHNISFGFNVENISGMSDIQKNKFEKVYSILN